MSDSEHNNTQDHLEPKAEDNAPINIKVSLHCHGLICGRRRVLPPKFVADDVHFPSQVTTQTGDEVFFKIKRNTKLSKLQGAYANKVGKDVSSIR